tara:strand:- start:2633 stop:3283 length:651 start_codon:yes stop_codon:yes gene_type:complete
MRNIVLAILLNSCISVGQLKDNKNPIWQPPTNSFKNLKKAYFASGCFWCVEAVFESVEGVYEVYSGYAGGHLKNPTYYQIGTGRTGHAEAVEILYNDKEIGYGTLLQVFFGSHDPTTLNRQGPDRGEQYRSMAFYQNEQEKKLIRDYIKLLETNKVFSNKIVTQIVPFEIFYYAEEYHQNYERLNPYDPYVKNVSIPRINRFKKTYPELLKESFSN